MKISLITPAGKQSKNGNRTTALRWARLLRQSGHLVRISTDYEGEATDVMIALHARHSGAAVRRYREQMTQGPLVVGLGGTDVNTFLQTERALTLGSMDMADALICLHDLIGPELPAPLRPKLHVVRQSAQPLTQPRQPSKRHFDICVIGHLRAEKDPFRTALAARLLPPTSRLRVHHLGGAHSMDFADQAQAEMARNPRYSWRGAVSGGQVRREFGKTHAMVISSVQEGGANVVSEAIVAGVPVIASDIAGNIGLLGPDYPGYYPVGDEVALAEVLLRAEMEPGFLKSLAHHGGKLAPLFQPAHEQAALVNIIAAVTRPG
ncbi:MAG: TIGR04348 family glycosyltransferase [Rhodospirillaceae bacterium]|nr:TIGR04348 family glycosyltransferase [Rhodospirillaceae bacterium]MBT4690631.1 TIGR04348 family glycosyltransferase [Rhodospirillaceae bacterium]MBT5080573.1 TIGR04348 family glycosyltransferase [Rhodospirillaceae bacterium]MBT5526558.1 TIGR04348 family glycosyltransferase [Rhodospirillaceae bacterium]MBT5877493.1 TIGR04348 family glycosyltransferase [Rhodospirillaceae bacterium]